MGLLKLLRRLFSGQKPQEPVHEARSQRGVEEIAQRLKLSVDELRDLMPTYRQFSIPKRRGGTRQIIAPSDPLKAIQRRILRRLLNGLPCHPAARGFESGQSIVTNAREHVGQAVIVRMDVKNFFASTRSDRITRYLQAIGWNEEASLLLTRLCTHGGGLPQGAPTSPRLSNLVNFRLDARLAKLGERLGARYTRYADDMTFSFATDDPRAIHVTIRMTKRILGEEEYQIHQHEKLVISRRNSRQRVTGLVVNERVNLPRATRRWLRAIEHRAATGRGCTLTAEQLAGWRALRSMIARGTGKS
jgi:RNA-directed DNA polymerase